MLGIVYTQLASPLSGVYIQHAGAIFYIAPLDYGERDLLQGHPVVMLHKKDVRKSSHIIFRVQECKLSTDDLR